VPDAALILPGFFGKLPAMGDFVTRRLPASFVGRWDRWISRNLVYRFSQGPLRQAPILRFLLGSDTFGPMTGVILASADRAGRRFPLTIAAAPPLAASDVARLATGWFKELEATGMAARDGELDGEGLATCLAALPFPATEASGGLVRDMMFWTLDRQPVEMDPDTPEKMIAQFFTEAQGVV
jgi:type VI secretion system protein ImpM